MIATKKKVFDKFAKEEIESDYIYPIEYGGPKPIEEQIRKIAKIFNLDATQALVYAKNLQPCPNCAEGRFAIPSVEALAKKYFPKINNASEKYCYAVNLVQKKIVKSRGLAQWIFCSIFGRAGTNFLSIWPIHLKRTARTEYALRVIAETQKSDILIIDCQLGMLHRGRSARRSRALFESNEFGLDSLAIGSIILTNPQRFARDEELHILCAGDEYSSSIYGDFTEVPLYRILDGLINLDSKYQNAVIAKYGSATAFIPQSEFESYVDKTIDP